MEYRRCYETPGASVLIILTYFTCHLPFEITFRFIVLPTFEVSIQASQPYHILKSESFPFNISARYVHYCHMLIGFGVDSEFAIAHQLLVFSDILMGRGSTA